MISNTIELWDKGNYESDGDKNFKPTLDTYILSGNKKRGAVLIFPGGGYQHTSSREAEPIAMQFNAAGFHAFILYYSVAPNKHPKPLMDASRAMCIIRENAEKWNVNPEKIAVCGFSAGGHLAASLALYYDKSYLFDNPQIKEGLTKPNALILSYPVITSGDFAHKGSFENLIGDEKSNTALYSQLSLENHISPETPPTFLWHTFDDGSVPVENSLFFANGLRKNKIPFELHIYPHGPHGYSLATKETNSENMVEDPHVATWMKLCTEWLGKIFK